MDIEFRTKLKKENNFLDLEIGDVFEYNHNVYMKIFDNVIGQDVCLCLFDNHKNLSAFTSDMICFDDNDKIKKIDTKLLVYQ